MIMYKVVIIDDEPIIVEGLSRMIPWEQYGCKIIDTANDGTEGMEVIRNIKPHMVLTDIAMPDLDGLTMLAGLKSEFPNLEISILTGYRNFDYAQRAIRLGVTRFLLKPSNMDEIIEAIEAMTAKLKKKNISFEKDYIDKEAEENEDLTEQSPASNFIVKNAMNYIKNNYSQKLTLAEVAEKTYISQWHLSKLLNRVTGQNFSEILNSIRIEEAEKLLKDPTLRIGDIAEKVGFVDLAHFSRVFKKIKKISANEYRNQM